ncbi:sensor histidine kinase [Dyadobacter fanqingshengii]|uniref:histidine kinase n=1 Tax=Dyadobacter fanqingshengii TaxID=2906443 RepID=A0A9X1PAJ0_9BACT|nr:two-component regulator propeller domain-containing protein [Dyadobacter fanqingshengii]MCF0039855.1 ATP-binding protein [Dyadobacter fanqingshengii]USJ38384.1 ATP-binding protein [Dyadobacter fanqingshengii]
MRIDMVIVLRWFLCLMLLAFHTKAQQQQELSAYRLQHFTDENGLPQNSVKAVMEDKNGFYWLATEAGVVRFDGQKFLTFDRSNLPIFSNRIRGFVPALPGPNANPAFEFYALTENNQYIGILNNGLVASDTAFYEKYRTTDPFADKNVRHNSMLGSVPEQYPSDPMAEHYFAVSDSRTFFIWKQKTVSCYKDGKLIYTATGSFKDFFLIGSQPYALDSAGTIIQITNKTTNKVQFPEGDIVHNMLYSRQKSNFKLYWNNVARCAFLYLNKSFYTLEESGNGRLTTKLILKDYDFADLDIVAAHYDRTSGALLLGSSTKGLFLIKSKNFQMLKLASKDADNAYYAQKPAGKHAVITGQGYQLGLNATGSQVVASKVSAFMENFAYKFAIAMNPDSSFWFGIGYNLFKLDKTAKKVLVRLKLQDNAKAFFIDQQHRLWIGSENNSLYQMESSAGQYHTKLVVKAPFGGVSIIGQGAADMLFIGGTKGVFTFNVRTKAVQKLLNFNKMNIRSFYTTADGTWIATYGNGIFLFKNNRLIQFPLDKDRFLATSHCITEDAKGFFWINTNRGLFQVARQQLLDYARNNKNLVYYLYYDRSQGFATNEFNGGCQPCSVRLGDGIVSLPSMDGLVWFSPNQIMAELPGKGIFITSINLERKEIRVTDTLKIPREFEQLRLQVTTPYLGHVKNIQMHYSLSGEGREQKWFPVNADFVIPIPKISYGNYKLTIRKVNGFKTNDYTYKTVRLTIARAWYETWWFRSVLALLILGLFFMAVKWRTGYLVKKERKDNLLRHYRVISQIVAAVNHDIQTPLHYIGYSLRQINAYLHKQDNGNPLITRMSDESLNTSERVGTLTKNLLDYIKIQNKNSSSRTHMGHVEVREMVSGICELFSAIAGFRGITIRNEVEPGFEVWSDPSLLSIVIHNLLDNALKISASEIIISTNIIAGKKQIIIEDSGTGMPGDLMKWLNKSYRSYEEWLKISLYPEQKGIGLVILKDLCVLLRIDIIASINAKNHTTVRLMFDQGKG